MKKLLLFLMAVVCLSYGQTSFAQTKIDLSKQKGVVPVVNGGTGNPGQTSVSTSPGAILFGAVQTGVTSFAQNVAISNTGTNPVNVISETLSGTGAAHFIRTNICLGVLDPGATCVDQVQYAPVSAIAESATLTVVTNAPVDPSNPLTVALSGSGTGAVTFPLTVNCSGLGTGTVTSGEVPPLINVVCNAGSASGATTSNYATGSVVALTAAGNNGSTFSAFSGCSLSTSPGNCTVSAATTVTANFTPPTQNFALSITGQGQGTGTITSDVGDAQGILNCTSTAGVITSAGNSGCSGTFPDGTVITLTETPNGSSMFNGWSGPCSGSATTCVITVHSNVTATANFGLTTSQLAKADGFYVTNAASGSNLAGTFNTQHAGGMDVCFLETNGAITVSSVADSAGNTWAALNTKTTNGTINQIAYGARNILAAVSNTVTVTYSGAMTFRSMRCLSYDGVITTSGFVDQTANGQGSGTAVAAGNLTTTVANDLLVCGTTSAQSVGTADTAHGYVQQLIDAPFNDDVEDRQGVPIGTYNCQPTLNSTASWVSQNIAFKAQSAGGGTSSSLTVTGSGGGNGTVAVPGGTCTISAGVTSGLCSIQVAAGSSVTLTETPGSGSSFTAWTGVTGCSTSPNCAVSNISGNVTAGATFDLSGVQNYYVSVSTGSDSNSGLCAVAGTPAGCTGPLATINKAVAIFQLGPSGAKINVAPGTYASTTGSACFTSVACINRGGTLGTPARLVVKCTTPLTCFLTTTVWLQAVNNVDFTGFDVGNLPSSNNAIASISTAAGNGNSLHIYGNYFHDVGQSVAFGGISGCINDGMVGIGPPHSATYANTDAQIIGNILFHYGTVGNGCTNAQGIYLSTANGIVQNNIVSNISTACVEIYNQPAGTIISNNTCYNSGRGIQLGGGGASGKITITNNTVTGIGGFGIMLGSGTGTCPVGSVLMANNMLSGNTTNFLVGANSNPGNTSCESFSGNITTETPATTFSNYVPTANGVTTGNMHLKAGSKAINGGTGLCVAGVSLCTPGADYSGTPRPIGPAIDIGAYEQ